MKTNTDERAPLARISLQLSLVTPQDALFEFLERATKAFSANISCGSNYDEPHLNAFNVQLEIHQKASTLKTISKISFRANNGEGSISYLDQLVKLCMTNIEILRLSDWQKLKILKTRFETLLCVWLCESTQGWIFYSRWRREIFAWHRDARRMF